MSGKKILIAEDDKFLADAYRLKFTKAGFEVKLARDGKETEEALTTFTPDLIILDIVMPVQDGFTTLSAIKANPAWKNIPVIVASNLDQKADREKSAAFGAIDYVVKSDLNLDQLITKINSLLTR